MAQVASALISTRRRSQATRNWRRRDASTLHARWAPGARRAWLKRRWGEPSQPPTCRLHPDSPKPCHPTDPSLQLTRWSGPAGCNLPSGACGTSWSAASCSPSAVSQRRATTPLFPRVTHRLTRSQTLPLSHTPSHTLTRSSTHPLSPLFAGEPAPINHHHRKRMRGVRQVMCGARTCTRICTTHTPLRP